MIGLLRHILILTFSFFFFTSCEFSEKLSRRAEELNNFENTALNFARENRGLKGKISNLEYEIQKLNSKNSYLKIQLDKRPKASTSLPKREISSVKTNDELVKFKTYKWKVEQMHALAQNGFKKEKFQESSDYFQSILENYPHYKKIDDRFFFQAGVASYESGVHYDRAMGNMKELVSRYPASPYYRGAKMWMGLTHLKLGENKKFFDIVEEFRMKYRNTSEWKLLSQHYEKIVQRYK